MPDWADLKKGAYWGWSLALIVFPELRAVVIGGAVVEGDEEEDEAEADNDGVAAAASTPPASSMGFDEEEDDEEEDDEDEVFLPERKFPIPRTKLPTVEGLVAVAPAARVFAAATAAGVREAEAEAAEATDLFFEGCVEGIQLTKVLN